MRLFDIRPAPHLTSYFTLSHPSLRLRVSKFRPQFPLTYRNPSAIIGLVRICALTAGAFSRFFFFRDKIRSQEEERPRAKGKGASFAHELCLLLTFFRINTCKSVSKQRTLTPFRMNTYEKHREGEGAREKEGANFAPSSYSPIRNASAETSV